MVSCNTRFRNKKGVALYVEVIIYIVLIVTMVIVIWLTNNLVTKAREVPQKAPEIYSDYPSLYVKTFLLQEIDLEDKVKLGYSNTDKVLIKDVIKINSDVSKEIVSKYRSDYILDYSESLASFNKNSQGGYFQDGLLNIEYGFSEIPDLDSYIKKGNYFFYFKDNSDKYIVIYFFVADSLVGDLSDSSVGF